MSSADTVIVDFTALQSAIRSFLTISERIAELETQLQSNATTLQDAWKSNASEAYSEKMQTLASNFKEATQRLNEEGRELERLYKLEWEAEQQAKVIANSVGEYTLS